MKLKSSLQRLCSSCYMVRRQGRLFVYCKSNPRHKQRQGRGPRRKLHTLGLLEEEQGQGMMGSLLKQPQQQHTHTPAAASAGCGCGGAHHHHRHHHHHASASIPRPLIPAVSTPLDMMAAWLAMATPTLRSLGARLRALLPGGSQQSRA